MADTDGPGQVLARLDRPTASEPTRLAVLSDLHLSPRASGTWKSFETTGPHLRAAVERVNARDPDAVLFAGDLTKDGTHWEYERFDELVADLDPPLFAIPGNHDLPTTFDDHESIAPSTFADRYGPGSFPYHRRVGGLDVLALNSHRATDDEPADTWNGAVSAADREWLADRLGEYPDPLVTVHHNLTGTQAFYEAARERLPVAGGTPGFDDAEALEDVLAANDAGLVLTGHLHFPAIVDSGGVREFTLPALGSFPGGYVLLDVDESGTTVRYESVATREGRLDVLGAGVEKDRVLIAASQLADLPLADDTDVTDVARGDTDDARGDAA